MSRRHNQEENFFRDLFQLLRNAPWWVGPPIILITWLILGLVIPGVFGMQPAPGTQEGKPSGLQILHILGEFSSQAALPITGLLALIWIAALISRRTEAKLLDGIAGIESIRNLTWHDFERLLAEAFRREGYFVETTPSGADGGVDLILTKDARKTIVQAKQWKKQQVGVTIVRELLGVKTAERANTCIVVTSGNFTDDAKAFAKRGDVRLIDGAELAVMISMVQSVNKSRAALPQKKPLITSTAAPASPDCPFCKAPMVKRLAKRGPNAGDEFWGCSRYPDCRGTVSVEPAS